MAPKLIIFTGAPEADSLDWDEAGLLTDFEPHIAKFAGLPGHDAGDEDEVIPATHPPWRSLPLKRQHLPTGPSHSFNNHLLFDGYSQQDSRGASFFTTSQIDSFLEELTQNPESQHSSIVSAEVLSQFYEESYARHEDVISSQIAPASTLGSSFTSDEYSYETSSFVSSFGQAPDAPIAGHLSSIKDIPNASYLNSIQPQTMTVNLIVGIISVPPPRTIKTKRGADVELIEILVGDETKSGFGINFWLPKTLLSDMGAALSGLRPQDVVLMRNIALSSFKGRVYGQSLRKEMTKVHLLYRNKISKSDVGGCYAGRYLENEERGNVQIEKTKRVKQWVARFVGVGVANRGQPSGKGRDRAFGAAEEVLPPDTQ